MRTSGRGAFASERLPPGIVGIALAGLLLGGAGAARAVDACVSPRVRTLQAIDAVRIVPHDFPAALAPVIERAMALWNGPACNGDDGFPRFRLETDEPHRVLHVRWVRGLSPLVVGSCGFFLGNEITLYSDARDPRDGVVRSCGNVARLAENLAHELGHALGLEDQYAPACAGHIMGQLAHTRNGAILPRQVQPQECAAADEVFLTLAERRGWADSERLAAGPGAAPGPRLTFPAGAAGSRLPTARIALGTRATESDGFRP